MTTMIFTQRGHTLVREKDSLIPRGVQTVEEIAKDTGKIIPRIGESIDLWVGAELVTRRYKVLDVIHQPGRGQVEVEVFPIGLTV